MARSDRAGKCDSGTLALMTGWFGWRGAFEMIGCVTLLMADLVWTVVRNRPQDSGWPSLAEIDEIDPAAAVRVFRIFTLADGDDPPDVVFAAGNVVGDDG